MARGLLLIAHGARDPQWATPFEAVVARLRNLQPQLQVQLSYLDFMHPDAVAAGAALVAEGCDQVAIAPMFLGSGGHVRRDIPKLTAQLAAAHPQVRWQVLPAIGELDSVLTAMAAALAASCEISPGSP